MQLGEAKPVTVRVYSDETIAKSEAIQSLLLSSISCPSKPHFRTAPPFFALVNVHRRIVHQRSVNNLGPDSFLHVQERLVC